MIDSWEVNPTRSADQIKSIIAFNYPEFMQGISEFDFPQHRVYNNDPDCDATIAYNFGRTIGKTYVD
jgi:hypothetical protein